MKIQIDTTNKLIIVDEEINLKHFVDFIQKIFPENEWEKYSLDVRKITYWKDPIVIKEYPTPTYPYLPFWKAENENKMLCFGVQTKI